MPQIAVTATSTTGLVSGSALSGKFAELLSSAADDIPFVDPEKSGLGTVVTSSKKNPSVKPDVKNGTKSSKDEVAGSKLDAQIPTIPQTTPPHIKLPLGIPVLALPTATPHENAEADTELGSTDQSQPGATPTSVDRQSSTTVAFPAVPFFGMSTLALAFTAPGQSCETTQVNLTAASEPTRPATNTDEKAPSPSTANLPKAEAVSQAENTKLPANAAIAVAADVTPRSNPIQASDAKPAAKNSEKSAKVPDKHASDPSSGPKADKLPASGTWAVPASSVDETVKNTSAQALPLARTGRNVASKSDSGIVPPSSQSLKKDGDAANNPPPSDKVNPLLIAHATAAVAGGTTSRSSTAATNNVAPASLIASVASKPTAAAPSKLSDAAEPSTQVATAMAKADASAEVLAHAGPVQVAKLIERAGQAELRVGIQTGEFGNVGIRTSMAHSQFSAEISVERGDLGRILSAELPRLHDRLVEQRVPVSNIVLQDHSAGSDLRQAARQNHYSQQSNTLGPEQAEANTPAFAVENSESETGLDLHM